MTHQEAKEMAAQSNWRDEHEKHMAEYREQARRTFQQFSDQALLFQDTIIRGGIDREECDRELNRRGL